MEKKALFGKKCGFRKELFLLVFSLVSEFFPENSGGRTDVFFEVITEGGGVFKSAGKGDLCDRIICGTEHLDSHPQTVPEEILLWGSIFMLHKYFVQVCPVDAHMSCHVRNADVVTVIVFYIFSG